MFRQNGQTPAYVAAEKGEQECLKLLIEAKGDFNTSDKVVCALCMCWHWMRECGFVGVGCIGPRAMVVVLCCL